MLETHIAPQAQAVAQAGNAGCHPTQARKALLKAALPNPCRLLRRGLDAPKAWPPPVRDESPSLHQIEHFGKGCLELQRLLDFVGAYKGIFPILQEARTLMIAKELDDR